MLELYDACDEARNYLDFFLAPNSEAELEKCKRTIRIEFFPKRGIAEKPSLWKCKKVVSDFKKLKVDPKITADLMLYFIEQASLYSQTYGGDMGESFYTVLENNFSKAINYIFLNGLLINFFARIETLIQLAGYSGYGFKDELQAIYSQYR